MCDLNDLFNYFNQSFHEQFFEYLQSLNINIKQNPLVRIRYAMAGAPREHVYEPKLS